MYSLAIAAVKRYLDKVMSLLQETVGPAYHGLYITNNQGKFELSPEPLVTATTLITNDEDLGYAKTTLQSNQYIFNSWQRISRGSIHLEEKEAAGLSDRSIVSDLDGFSFDVENDVITNDIDTRSMVGFVSPDSHETYVLDVTLSAAPTHQNDPIGLLLGYVRGDDGRTHTLTVFRNIRWSWGVRNTDAVIVRVNANTVEEIDIAWTSEGLVWSDGSPATGSSPGWSGHDETAASWEDYPEGLRLRVERTGDDYVIKTSNLGSDVLVDSAELHFNLSDRPELNKFKGATPYGYVAVSQNNAIWTATQRPGNAPTVIDARTGDKHEWDGTTWNVISADLEDSVKRGRLYYNNYNGKAFYCDSRGWVQQISEA